MRILFVSSYDLVAERLWGPTSRLFSLAKQFKEMGHTAIFAGGYPYNKEPKYEKEGIRFEHLPTYPFHRYPYDEETLGILETKRKKFMVARALWVAVKRAIAIRELCRTESIDVIYLGRTAPETAMAVFLARFLSGRKVVVDWDDIEGLMGFSSSARLSLFLQYLYTFCETFFAVRADAVVAASKFIHDYCLDIGVKKEKLHYARTVGDHLHFTQTELPWAKHPEKPTLFYAGNLRSDNGVKVENVLYTFAEVKKSYPRANLLVAGGGDLLETGGLPSLLPKLAKELGVAESVSFTGDVPYAQMPSQIARADICLALFPVNVITLAKSPIKVYEYLCAGKPVVARAVGEIGECIIDGENGYLVYSDDPKEYARKIVDALSDPARLAKVGLNGRRSVEERFNWKASAKTALKACEKVYMSDA